MHTHITVIVILKIDVTLYVLHSCHYYLIAVFYIIYNMHYIYVCVCVCVCIYYSLCLLSFNRNKGVLSLYSHALIVIT